MAKFLATIKAIITRLVFASHGFIAIWQVTTFKKNPLFWYLSCPILLLFFEGIFTLTIKENQEWKWKPRDSPVDFAAGLPNMPLPLGPFSGGDLSSPSSSAAAILPATAPETTPGAVPPQGDNSKMLDPPRHSATPRVKHVLVERGASLLYPRSLDSSLFLCLLGQKSCMCCKIFSRTLVRLQLKATAPLSRRLAAALARRLAGFLFSRLLPFVSLIVITALQYVTTAFLCVSLISRAFTIAAEEKSYCSCEDCSLHRKGGTYLQYMLGRVPLGPTFHALSSISFITLSQPFCPSVFLYLSSVVPAIWLLELDKVDRRMKTFETNVNISENFDLTNLAAEDLKHLEKALGVNINLPDIKISTETWVTLIEQFLMLILIIGRWMLPKGDLTRDQLSQLLLVYIGTAADIIEFFDSFKEDRIAREPVLVYLTLGIWAWSLMQFTVVLTATKSRKSRLSSGSAVKRRVHSETSCCSIDVWGIALNMLLQDGPFLAFRLILIVHYRIVSYMNIFFTCKNTLVILLQLYRLYVVQTENRSKVKKKSGVSNISIISREDIYNDVRSKKFSEERKRKRRERDIEANYSESEETTEEADKFDSSPRNIGHSRKYANKFNN
ncbi:hypothetical protein K0M31_008198 [Melipona bicolor]|uniref:Transmembrane protein 26 n=1 Tax=Melipona bicolor TaxID=60889 RepID=A0AA40FQH0_9HYME|nr:hypothetical protein K0M31_008198 [Melipona bicolor]